MDSERVPDFVCVKTRCYGHHVNVTYILECSTYIVSH